MEFQLLIKSNMLKKNKDFSCFQLLDVMLIMQINVKMPTIVGILTFMSMINICSVELGVKTSFITSGSGHLGA